ncbi:MAG: BspA family leucine-rich repeat surface protein [Cryomorphaceae bacterium]|nr:MAG: BspA family leucine-rich repeat surface protein [Cryomorphaceae bacterium]
MNVFFIFLKSMKKYTLLFVALLIVSCSSEDEKELPFYVDDNGVTIKAKDWVTVGTTADLKGIVFGFNGGNGGTDLVSFNHSVYYTAVDLAWLKNVLNTYSDLSTLVTTKVEITSLDSAAGLFLRTEIKGMENWDVSNWTSMYGLFDSDKPIKSDLSYWDVSNVEDFRLAMQLETTDPNINNWDVSKATNMSGFFSTSSENKYIEGMDLSEWNVSKVTNCSGFFGGITNWPESKKPNFTNCSSD